MTPADGGAAFPAVPGFNPILLEKFTSRIDGGDWAADKCWLWSGYRNPKGYGVFAPAKAQQYRAHRFALAAYLGREPAGMVLHACDNPGCVNPLHLSEGTHTENMHQMADRRRAARGQFHPKAKLTSTKAIAICVLHRGRDFSTQELADLFGMSQPTIAAIVAGQLWKDEGALADTMLAERAK